MSEIKDDPREILILLNSLGFVGITAAQLKAFMKDLKVYRKVKERERQQRKEEIKTKIIDKQHALFEKARQDSDVVCSSKDKIVPSMSSNSIDNESLVKVRIRCIPIEKNVQKPKHSETTVVNSDKKLEATTYKGKIVQVPEEHDIIYHEREHSNTKINPIIKHSKSEGRQSVLKDSEKDNYLLDKCKHSAKIDGQGKTGTSLYENSVNEPILAGHISKSQSKSIISDPTENMRAHSASSVKSSANSGHKSFIRPWRLHPEAQKNMMNKKCDPVALYQKYQQEWKHVSFPGEAKHSKVRWAVREKMLGTDPHPMPLPRKAISMPILKRK